MPPLPRKALLRAKCRCRYLEAEGDRHEFCFVCMGPRHARDGLVDSPDCESCACLSVSERRLRFDFFQVEEPLEDVVSALLSDEESSEFEDHLEAANEAQPSSRDPPVEVILKNVLRTAPLSFPDVEGRALSSISEDDEEPAPGPTVTSALSRRADFPAIIKKAAEIMGVPLPASPPVEEEDPWEVGPHAKRMKTSKPLCPTMPKLADYVQGSWEAPLMANAPVKALLPFTRVTGLGEAVKTGPPPLEPSLAAYLVPGASAWMTTKKANLPSSRDKLTASLADKAYVWGAQAAAASGNAALLTAAVSKLSTEKPEGLSPEETSWVARMASAALHLNQGAAICAGRAMGNSLVVHRHLWLSLTAMREADKSALLNAPVTGEGLFGPAVAAASERFSRLEEERKHLLGHMPLQKKANAAPFSIPAGATQGRRKRARRPVARAATATQAAPPATPVPPLAVPPERAGYSRPPNPSWRGGGGGKKRRA